MSPEQYLGVLANIAGAIDALSEARPEWESVDDRLDAWDQLDRLHGDLLVLIREHAVELAANLPGEYLHPRAGLVHTETEKSEAWDGSAVLNALSADYVNTDTGEYITAIPTDVLLEVLPAVKEGRKSSKWSVTGLRKEGLDPDNYRAVSWGDRLVRRGPRYNRKATTPRAPSTGTVADTSPLPAGGQSEPGIRPPGSGAS